MSEFQKLLGELEELSAAGNEDVTKSMATDGDDDAGAEGEGEGAEDDAAIAAAAADGEAAGEAADAAGEGEGEGEGDELGKSLTVIGENGEEEEAIDATDLLKSLVAKAEHFDGVEQDLLKGLTLVTDLVKSQAAEIGSLKGQLATLAGAGRGRRAVVSVSERPALAKSLGADGAVEGDAPEGIPANEFMAKAMDAFSAGKITGGEVSRAESYINRGLDVPASIKTKVLGA